MFLGKTLYSHGAFIVASYYGNWDKLRPGGPLDLKTDFTFTYHRGTTCR